MRIVEQKVQCSECRKYYPLSYFNDPALPNECCYCIDKFMKKMKDARENSSFRQKQSKKKKERKGNRYTNTFIAFDNTTTEERDHLKDFFKSNVGVLFENKESSLKDLQDYFYHKFDKKIALRTVRRILSCIKLKTGKKI